MVFDRIGLIMLGVFPFVIMFLVTSIAMLRERTTGTLERLLTTPMGKLDLLFAYGIAFGLAAAVQASIGSGVAYWLFDLEPPEPRLVILSRSRTRCSGSRSGCSAAPLPAPSSRRCSSCRSWCIHNCCSADCLWPATRWPAGYRRSATCCPLSYAVRRCRRSARTPSPPPRSGGTWASWPGRGARPRPGRGDPAEADRIERDLGGPRASPRRSRRDGKSERGTYRPAPRQPGHPRSDPRRGPESFAERGLRRRLDPDHRRCRRGRPGTGTSLLRHQGSAVPGRDAGSDRSGQDAFPPCSPVAGRLRRAARPRLAHASGTRLPEVPRPRSCAPR